MRSRRLSARPCHPVKGRMARPLVSEGDGLFLGLAIEDGSLPWRESLPLPGHDTPAVPTSAIPMIP
jgi:hypothetical protein